MNNYETQLHNAASAFCAYDTAKLAQDFGLQFDEEAIYLNVLGKPCRICRKSGSVKRISDDMDVGFNLSMTVYDMLTNPNGKPILSGQWCAHTHFNAVRGGTVSGKLEVATEMPHLCGKIEALRQACFDLGGVQTDSGDFAAILPLFDFFPVLLRFYDADEEFAPQLQLLWDAKTTSYLRYETTFYAAGAVLERIKDEILRKQT